MRHERKSLFAGDLTLFISQLQIIIFLWDLEDRSVMYSA